MAAHRAANDTANNLRNYTTPRDSYKLGVPYDATRTGVGATLLFINHDVITGGARLTALDPPWRR
jgi:hypothetical protein